MPAGIELARHACLPCRRSKRRCDRKLPSCDLCIKKDTDCNYPGARTSERDSRTVYSQTPDSQSSPETVRSCNTEASAVYFLAPHLFRQAQLELPRSDFPIPAEVSSLIGDASSIREIAKTFFSTIHLWLPIIFKKGFFVSMLNPWTQRQTELSLLALCMKLCNTAPSEDDGSNNFLYRTAKRFHHEVVTAGVLSTHVLQAGLLIALYEMGHAMYPAAYLTVGACSRYGLALGIQQNCYPTSAADDGLEMRGQRSWNEVEENRRVWWAVLTFDRFLNLNNPARPLSTEDPTFDTYLPVDDTSWNDCTAKASDSVKISTGFSLKLGGFARHFILSHHQQ
uniref:Putative transcriptional regulatory protein PB1A11.04c n=1 Tax=Talaromyces marneffei PM1 TaxID=1077442 RepID=A0A093V036_TALMA